MATDTWVEKYLDNTTPRAKKTLATVVELQDMPETNPLYKIGNSERANRLRAKLYEPVQEEVVREVATWDRGQLDGFSLKRMDSLEEARKDPERLDRYYRQQWLINAVDGEREKRRGEYDQQVKAERERVADVRRQRRAESGKDHSRTLKFGSREKLSGQTETWTRDELETWLDDHPAPEGDYLRRQMNMTRQEKAAETRLVEMRYVVRRTLMTGNHAPDSVAPAPEVAVKPTTKARASKVGLKPGKNVGDGSGGSGGSRGGRAPAGSSGKPKGSAKTKVNIRVA